MPSPDALRTQALSIAGASSVAAAAGVTMPKWQSHVQWYVEPWLGAVNIGRLPLLLLTEVDTAYTHQTQPGHGGTRTSVLRGRVCTRCFNIGSNNPRVAYDRAVGIIRAFFALMRASDSPWELGNDRIMAAEPSRYGISVPFELEINTSYNNEYQESLGGP